MGCRDRVVVLGLMGVTGCIFPTDDTTSGSGGGGADDGVVPQAGSCEDVADWDSAYVEFEEEVLVRVNQARSSGANCGGRSFGATHNLRMNGTLRCSARLHSADMAARNFFEHVNPDGESPSDRMSDAGYDWSYAGENIAAGQRDPDEVMQSWMGSPGHCANIMSPDFDEIGVGYIAAPMGAYPHLWTQNFGTPF